MGNFSYGSPATCVKFEDRVLAHLKAVIAVKLRRGEGFLFTWKYHSDAGSGYSSVWIHPAIPLQFDFVGSREPHINREWVEALLHSANSGAGLTIVAEPNAPASSMEGSVSTGPTYPGRLRTGY